MERQLAKAKASKEALDAGRLAQIQILSRALKAIAPSDPALRITGRTYDDGSAELQYETAFQAAYDDVAQRHGLPLCRMAMTADERADEAEAAVLAEPIKKTRFLRLFHRRWWWRGDEYRSEAGAIRAREDAARDARTAVMVANRG